MIDVSFDAQIGQAHFNGQAYTSEKLKQILTNLDGQLDRKLPISSDVYQTVEATGIFVKTVSGTGLSVMPARAEFTYGKGLSGIYVDGKPFSDYISADVDLSEYYKMSQTSSSSQLSGEFAKYLPLTGGTISGDLTIKNGNRNQNTITFQQKPGVVALLGDLTDAPNYKMGTVNYLGTLNAAPKANNWFGAGQAEKTVRTCIVRLEDRTNNRLHVFGEYSQPDDENYIDLVVPPPVQGECREFRLCVQFSGNYVPRTKIRQVVGQGGEAVTLAIPFSWSKKEPFVSGQFPDLIEHEDVLKAVAARWPAEYIQLLGRVCGIGEDPDAPDIADFINEMTDGAYDLDVQDQNFNFKAFYTVQKDYLRPKQGITVYQFNEISDQPNVFMVTVKSGNGLFSIYGEEGWPV